MNLKNYCYCYLNVLTEKFCNDVITYGNMQKLDTAITGEKQINQLTEKEIKKIKKIRKSDVSFFNDAWIFKEIKPWIDKANIEAKWNFNIDYAENFQFTKYALNQFYDWHCDSYPEPYNNHENKNFNNKTRKISVSCVLSKPEDYEGGDLEFNFRNTKKPMNLYKLEKLPQGSIVVFPSFVWHRVKPVTNGTRYSLVIWNLGPSFI